MRPPPLRRVERCGAARRAAAGGKCADGGRGGSQCAMGGGAGRLALLLLLAAPPAQSVQQLCLLSYCNCSPGEVVCEGGGGETLILSSGSLPATLPALSLTNLASLTIKTDTFKHVEDLKELTLENIGKVSLKKFFFSSVEAAGRLEQLTFENIWLLELESRHSLAGLPRITAASLRNISLGGPAGGELGLLADTLLVENSRLGQLGGKTVASNADTLVFINNNITTIKPFTFSSVTNLFNFTGNRVDRLEEDAFAISALNTEISGREKHIYCLYFT